MKKWLLYHLFKNEIEKINAILEQKNNKIKNLENALYEMKSTLNFYNRRK